MLKGFVAAATVVMACAPAQAIVQIVGTFSGTIGDGLYYSPEVPETLPYQTAKPEFSQDLAGEIFEFDVRLDIRDDDPGPDLSEGEIGVSNSRSLGGLDVWLGQTVLTVNSLNQKINFDVPSFNISGTFEFSADRDGTRLSNLRGGFAYAGQYYPVYAFWSVAGRVESLSFEGQIDGFTIARSSAPEPASWAMMIAGFGLTGASLRRRPRYSRSRSLRRC